MDVSEEVFGGGGVVAFSVLWLYTLTYVYCSTVCIFYFRLWGLFVKKIYD